MEKHRKVLTILLAFFGLAIVGIAAVTFAGGGGHGGGHDEKIEFPRSLESYHGAENAGIVKILLHRIKEEPFNLVATLIFFMAIVHTFLSSKFLAISHRLSQEHNQKKKEGTVDPDSVHIGAGILHFMGEVEAVFGLWAVGLCIAISIFYDWNTVVYYMGQKVNYTEPMFVVVIMTLASSRPILKLSELLMWKVAQMIGGMLTAWWLTILTIGPLMGSFITEPAAMTICAYLLASKFYDLGPSEKFQFATIGLLFVNISVGGTLTHFAAPPVLMVAGPWDWGMGFMIVNFGWKAALGIVIANAVYYYMFRSELDELQKEYLIVRSKREIQRRYIIRKQLESQLNGMQQVVDRDVGYSREFDERCNSIKSEITEQSLKEIDDEAVNRSDIIEALAQRFEDIKAHELKKTLPGLLPESQRPPYRDPDWDKREDWVPKWIMGVHVVFIIWTVINAHHPALFIGGFLFYLGFAQVTAFFQNRIDLKPALLVGFFLAGLVIHGGLQAWWIAPLLGSLTEIPLMLSATCLTAFNDNAAITYLSTLVPGLTDSLKYAVVAGAVTGGGLTVIANAPNPAGQSILKRYFKHGVVPVKLLKAALIPTIIMGLCFMLLRF